MEKTDQTKNAWLFEIRQCNQDAANLSTRIEALLAKGFSDTFPWSFKDIQAEPGSYGFQIIACAYKLIDRGIRAKLPVQFFQELVEALPQLYVGWSAQNAANAAAQHVAEAEGEQPPVEPAPPAAEDDDFTWPETIDPKDIL